VPCARHQMAGAGGAVAVSEPDGHHGRQVSCRPRMGLLAW
jgi:hypothetical protein